MPQIGNESNGVKAAIVVQEMWKYNELKSRKHELTTQGVVHFCCLTLLLVFYIAISIELDLQEL